MTYKQLLGKPNQKLKKAGIKQYSIPAYKTLDGSDFTTCPWAGECALWCYAGGDKASGCKGNFYHMPDAERKHHDNLNRYLTDPKVWKYDLVMEIGRLRSFNPIRIHDDGDYFSLEYLNDWKEVISKHPDRIFYSYTKSLPFFDNTGWQVDRPNLFIRFSFGGKLDHLIDVEKHHHAKVFMTVEEAEKAGYTVCPSDDDIMAFDDSIIKLGLVFHGPNTDNFKAGQ